LVAVAAPAASADVTGPTGMPTGPTAGTIDKKSSKKHASASALPSFSIAIAGAYKYHGRRYVLPRALIEIKGKVSADLDGQVVTLVIKRGHRVTKTDAVRLIARGGKSSFSSAFRAGKKGKYVAEIQLTPAQATVVAAGSAKSVTVVKTGIHRGSSGVAVKLFQSKLAALNYVVPRNGRFDAATGRALIAFRKVNGMARNESAGYKVARKLAEGKGTFHLRYPGAGRHVEVSIKKQVMAFAEKGKVVRIYHVSTGKASTPTVRGTYHVYRKDPGTNAKGMVKSNYFIGGYAIHGYAEVPTYNASHGCVRVPVPNAASIFAWVHMGTRVDTYY
jgi:lipoprotein-anchoring transpeptidase ErfK/SrfK